MSNDWVSGSSSCRAGHKTVPAGVLQPTMTCSWCLVLHKSCCWLLQTTFFFLISAHYVSVSLLQFVSLLSVLVHSHTHHAPSSFSVSAVSRGVSVWGATLAPGPDPATRVLWVWRHYTHSSRGLSAFPESWQQWVLLYFLWLASAASSLQEAIPAGSWLYYVQFKMFPQLKDKMFHFSWDTSLSV